MIQYYFEKYYKYKGLDNSALNELTLQKALYENARRTIFLIFNNI